MKHLPTALLAALLIAAGVIIWMQHQALGKLQAETDSLRDQNGQLNTSNENLSNLVAQATSAQAAGKEQLNELLKLRGEVSTLRSQAGQLGKMRAENQQLRTQAATGQAQTSELTPQEQFQLHEWHAANALKEVGLAMKIHAGDNNGQFATNFDQILPELNNVTNFPGNISLDEFEFMNVGVAGDNTPNLMMFRERTPRQRPEGGWSRIYGLSDGSVQTRYSDDGNFDKADQDYSPPPLAQ